MPRKPKRMTTERRAEIERAMEAADGVASTASGILGCKPATLANWIKSDDILLRKWRPDLVKDDGADPEIHRPTQINPVEAKTMALAKEDRSLAAGFRDLGFSKEEIEFLTPLAEFTNGRFEQVIDLTYGGMVNNTAKLLKLFQDTLDQVLKIQENPSAYDETNSEGVVLYSGWKKLKEARSSLLEIQKEIRATKSEAEETMITRAKIKEIQKRQAEEAANKTLKKPAFGGPPEVFGHAPKMEQHIHHHHEPKPVDAET